MTYFESFALKLFRTGKDTADIAETLCITEARAYRLLNCAFDALLSDREDRSRSNGTGRQKVVR